MKIKVTKKHIAAGTPIDCGHCPIALALRDMGFNWVRVDQDNVEAGESPNNFRLFQTTRKMADFIERFDSGIKVGPTEFSLREIK